MENKKFWFSSMEVPEELYNLVKEKSEKENRSISQQVIWELKKAMGLAEK